MRRGQVLATLIEASAAYFLFYCTSPASEQRAIRLALYRTIQVVAGWIAQQSGKLALECERRYYAEVT
jgi:hypothetical protein